MRTARSKRFFRSRQASRSDRSATRRPFSRACCFEALEPRNLLAATSIGAQLAVWVDSVEVDIPTSISGSVGTYTCDDGALTIEADSDVTLADLFEGWNTQDSTASLSSTELMSNVADTTSTVKMFVNGEVSTEFENYVISDGDEIVLAYGDNPIVSLNTNFGPIVIELFKESSPSSLLVDSSVSVVPDGTVANFLNYINDGDYLDTIIHRSDPDFVIQGGGYSTTSSTFTSTDQLTAIDTDDAITNEPGLTNILGTMAMAKVSGDADSATSQFFINLGDNSFLDSEDYDYFTVFAQVLDMTTVNEIASLTVNTDNSSPFGELPLGDDDELVMIESIEGLGTLTGTKFYDADGDGVFDSGEVGVSGITVYIDANANGSYDSGETCTTTDSNGEYLLEVEPGTYTIRADVSSGYTETLPVSSTGHSVTAVIGETISALDFGESDMGAPSGIDLVEDTDSGTYSTDDVTNFNNSSDATALQFLVSGLLDGATVYLYCDSTLIGSGTASGATATISTDGATTLSDGAHSFTATQSLSGSTSDACDALSVTIDVTAPGALASTPAATANVDVAYTFDADSPDEGETGLVYSLTDAPDGMTIDAGTGVITWTPTEDQAVPQFFEIVVTDLAGNATTTTVDMTVYGAIPAEADSYTVTEDSSLTVDADNGVLVNDGDDDSGTLTASLVSSPSNGTVSFESDGSFTYTPYDDFSGTDSFTYQGTDGENDTNVAKVTITVTAVNDSPTGGADTYTVDEDGTLTVDEDDGVLANDSDPDSDTLTATVSTDVSNGTLSLSEDGSFTYTPDADFNGTDTFTYILSDGSVTINSISVTISVTSIGDAPDGVADTYSVDEDGSLTVDADEGVLVNDSDVEGDSVIAALGTEPSNGTVTFSEDGSFTYTPDADFYGTDTFTYTATDGTNVSSDITVTINVSGVADSPTATDDTYSVSQGSSSQSFSVLDNDSSDPDGSQTLTISTVTQGTEGGTVVINDTSIEYTPEDGFVGTDTFTYTITDTDGLSATATVTVTVSSANNSLSGYVYLDADGDAAMDSTEIGIPGVLVTLTGTDTDGNSVSRTAITDTDGSYQFTGLASGTYALTESQPVAMLDGTESTEITGATVGSDTITEIELSDDASGVCYFGEAGLKPSHISVRLFLASTPDPEDYLTEIIASGEEAAGNTDLAAAIRAGKTTLDNANTPVAVADSYSVDTNTTLTIDSDSGVLANDSDDDGDSLTAVLVSDASNGTLTLSDDGSFTYVPDTDYTGTDTFTYYASDGTLTSSTVSVTITVGDTSTTNTAPTVVADSYTVTEDNTLTVESDDGVLANDSDDDGDSLTVALLTDVANGTLDLSSDGSFTYTPDADFSGTDTFTYYATDGTDTSDSCTVTITVSAVNDTPVAASDSYSVTENGTLTVASGEGVLANDADVDDDTLTAALVSDTNNGTLSLSDDGSFTYTPDADYTGTDSFTYQASDGLLGSSTVTVTLTISEANSEPSAVSDEYEVDEDGTLTVDAGDGVLANDSDDDDTLTATLITDAANGTLVLSSDGSFTYTPDEEFNGTDTFGYQASDGDLASDTCYVTLTVNAVADAPEATADSYRISVNDGVTVDAEDGVLSNDTDADGDSLTASLVTSPANGTLTMSSDGSFTYAPDTDFQGTDTFTYTASDGTLVSDETTVTIYVNTLPTVVADTYEVDEDGTLTVAVDDGVLANDSDYDDGDTLTAVIATEATNGTVTLSSDGSFTYTPDEDFNGTDTFTYTANDGCEDSEEATVTITVNSIEDSPDAVDDTYSTPVDTALTVEADEGVLANDTDGDGDDLTVALLTSPENGTISLSSDGSFTYTPNSSYHGSDSFTYTLTDDTDLTDTATVTIGVNTQAVGTADTYTVDEDGTLTVDSSEGVLANDTDGDDDSLTAVLATSPSNGTLSLSEDGSFVYTPNADFSGTDTFTYVANDSIEDSAGVTVTITVAAINDTPAVVDDSYRTGIDEMLTVTADEGLLANDSDADGDGLSCVVVTSPAHGSLNLSGDGSFTYTPTAEYQGTDTFTYTATDGSLVSEEATVTITVNDTLATEADEYSVNEDQALTVSSDEGILANDSDADGDTLTVTLVSSTAHGTLSLNTDGSFTYTPDADFNGTDTFVYTASDSLSESDETTVAITVVPQADSPVAVADAYAIEPNATLTVEVGLGVLANDADPDGDSMTAVLASSANKGIVTLSADGSFVYMPNTDYTGSDAFTYYVTDGTLTSDTVTVSLTIAESNEAPVAVADTYHVNEDTTLTVAVGESVLLNDSDADSDDLTAILVAGVSSGTLDLAGDGSFTYTPNTDFAGTDAFTYRATDGTLNSDTVTVTITVDGLSDAPVAVAESYSTTEDTTLTIAAGAGVLANDSDVDGDGLSAVLVTNVINGTLELASDGSFVYTPDGDFNGTDTFTYYATDGTLASATVTVTLTVDAVNDAPVGVVDSYRTPVGEDLSVAVADGVLVNDTDVEDNSLTAEIVTNATHGSVTLSADGSFTYTPDASGFHGTDSFTYKVSDGGSTSTATVTIEVNSLPTGVADTYEVDEDGSLDIDATSGVLTNDADADLDSLTVTLVTTTTHGTLTLAADGSFEYWPVGDYCGTDTFVYTANDGLGSSAETTVTITVNQVSQMQISLEFVDESGDAVTEVAVGDTFTMNVYVQDIRSTTQGVSAAYMDVTYDSDYVTVGTVTYGTEFPSGHSADTTTTDRIDEAGAATASTSSTPSEKHLLFSVTFTASAIGSADFGTEMADTDVYLTGITDALTGDKIMFGFASLEITSASAGLASYGSTVDQLFEETEDWLSDLG